MGNTYRYSLEQVSQALISAGGLRSHAARSLGCSPSTVTNYIERYPELQAVESEIRENTLDLAEGKLVKLIREENLGAIIFFLKTKGKGRGYTTQVGLSNPDGSGLFEQFFRAASQANEPGVDDEGEEIGEEGRADHPPESD